MYEKNILRMIFRYLSHPRDLKAAQSVCKVWYEVYSLKDIVLDIRTDDPELWDQLLIIRDRIELHEGKYKLRYFPDYPFHPEDGIERHTYSIILVQVFFLDELFKRQDTYTGSWITTTKVDGHYMKYKNPLMVITTSNELCTSKFTKGHEMSPEVVQELTIKRMNYQKINNKMYERNIILKFQDILDWIKI